MKIKEKFTFSIIIIQILIMLIFSYLIIVSQKNRTEEKFRKKIEMTLDFVRISNMQPMFHLNTGELKENISAVMDDKDICKILIKDDFETVVAETEVRGNYDIMESTDFIIDGTKVGTAEIYFTKNQMEMEIYELQHKIAIMVILLFIIIVLVIRIIALITVKPIKSILKITKEIESGDFRNQVTIKTKDEMALIGDSLNEIINRFRKVLLEVEKKFVVISSSSNEIESGNDSLVEKISEQSDIVEQASESMKIVKQGIDEVTSNVKENNNYTKDTASMAIKLREISSELKTSIRDILVSTEEIQNISELINDISFETSLLSLNASIEAARSGMNGKRFSVIAINVRKLANRSSESVERIDRLIEESYINVKKGEKTVEDALQNIDEVVMQVEELEKSTERISQKIVEQEGALEDINQLIIDLIDINQHHASLSEEYYTMIQELNLQTKKFSEVLNHFKLK